MGDPLVSTSASSSSSRLAVDGDSDDGSFKSGNFVFPGVDGSLYTVDSAGLQILPIGIEEVVESSPFQQGGMRFLGNKETHVLRLNKRTGAILDAQPDDPDHAPEDLLWFSKTDFKVRAYNHRGLESWNVSLGRFNGFSDAEGLDGDSVGKEPLLLASVHGDLLKLDSETHSLMWARAMRDSKNRRVAISSVHFAPDDMKDDSTPRDSTPRKLQLQYVDVKDVELMAPPKRDLAVLASYVQAQHSTFVGTHDGAFFALPSRTSPLIPPSYLPPPSMKGTSPDADMQLALPPTSVCSSEHPSFPACLPGFHPVMEPDDPLLPAPGELSTSIEPTELSLPSSVNRNVVPAPPDLPSSPQTYQPSALESFAVPMLSFFMGNLSPWSLTAGASSTQSLLLTLVWALSFLLLLVAIRGFFSRHTTAPAPTRTPAFAPTDISLSGEASRSAEKSDEEKKAETPQKKKAKKRKKKNQKESSSDSKSEEEVKQIGKSKTEEGVRQIGKMQVHESKVLGTGSRGTIVCEGYFEGRAVAIKRMVKPHQHAPEHEKEGSAAQEVALLIASDQHPNVVRYYAQEEDDYFIYIALERCYGNLEKLVYTQATEAKHQTDALNDQRWRRQLLQHMALGLQHLHALKIVHRDLKPANILYTQTHSKSDPSSYAPDTSQKAFVTKIADMGLGKKLDMHRSSYDSLVTGSVGWQPPELLQEAPCRRLTKAVDIFSAGCIIYYVLTNGEHPFGRPLERELNIVEQRPNLDKLAHLPEAHQLVSVMIKPEQDDRITAEEVVDHCFFWDAQRRLEFLMHVSDCLEALPDGHVIPEVLEGRAELVVGDWRQRILPELLDNLGKFRKYNYGSVRDFLRVIRNKAHHYRELSADVRQRVGSMPDGFVSYFTSAFPHLILYVYAVFAIFVLNSPESRRSLLKNGLCDFPVCEQEVAMLQPYFTNLSHQQRVHLADNLQLNRRQWYKPQSHWCL
eukprot:g60556.t1